MHILCFCLYLVIQKYKAKLSKLVYFCYFFGEKTYISQKVLYFDTPKVYGAIAHISRGAFLYSFSGVFMRMVLMINIFSQHGSFQHVLALFICSSMQQLKNKPSFRWSPASAPSRPRLMTQKKKQMENRLVEEKKLSVKKSPQIE